MRSKDPNYTFCPAPHRAQVLRIFTRHYCRHPLFPTRSGTTCTAAAIRELAVREMYEHEPLATLVTVHISSPLSTSHNNDRRESLETVKASLPTFHAPTSPRPCLVRHRISGCLQNGMAEESGIFASISCRQFPHRLLLSLPKSFVGALCRYIATHTFGGWAAQLDLTSTMDRSRMATITREPENMAGYLLERSNEVVLCQPRVSGLPRGVV